MEYNEQYVNQLKREERYTELFEYLITFSEIGQSRPLLELSTCYYKGRGVEKDYSKVFCLDSMAAKTKDPDAIATLGYDFLYGIGVESDEEKAIALLNKAVSLDSAKGMSYLGICYQKGLGVVKNEEMAFSYYSKSAAKGNTFAQCELGFLYENGIGTTVNKQKAFEWYKKAAVNNDAWAQNRLGLCYHNGEGTPVNKEKAFEWFQKAAEQGFAGAQYDLAICYQNGEGTPVNKEKAFEWYKKAAEQDNTTAQIILALYYANGEGTSVDKEKAFEWFQKAAIQGDAYAQFCLSFCYKNGEGIPVDKEKAFEWSKQAAEQGYENAQFNLAFCYENGEGTPVNKEKAFEWYKKAAEQGNANAQNILAICYANGEGTSVDIEKAFEWYKKAAEQGEINAQNNLAFCYENGKGTPADKEKAFEWYKKAAANNDAWAQNQLGLCYENGIGTTVDKEKAFELYLKAAEQGNAYAQNHVGECYEHGIGIPDNDDAAVFWYKKCVDSLEGTAKANCYFAIYRLLSRSQSKESKREACLHYSNAYASLLNEANNGNAEAIDQLCRLLNTRRKQKVAYKYLTDRCDGNDDPIIEELRGEYLFYGIGCKKNQKDAVRYFESAYKQGNELAKIYFSLCYAKGYGVKKNQETARMILEKKTSSSNRSTELKGLLIFAGEWGYEKNKELGLSLIKEGTQNELQRFYAGLSSPRGVCYAKTFLELFFVNLRYNFNETFGLKIFWFTLKLGILLLLKNPYSAHLTRKEIEQFNLQLSMQQNELMKQQNQLLELQNILKEQSLYDRNAFREEIISQIHSSRDVIVCNQDRNANIITEKITEKLEEIENIMIPVLNFVAEQKKKLPDNNALQYLSEEQIEEIRVRFIDETAKKIVEKMDYDTPSVEKEKSLLMGMFDVYWEKLDEYTRKSLLSAKILFNNCQRAEYASLDHSGIVIAATSALENELKQRFFIGFQQYLTKKNIKCSEWPNVLVFFKKSGECVPNANFELGSFKYIIKCSEKDKLILNEYLQQMLSDQISTKDVSVFTNKGNKMPSFLERCEDVRTSYRNPAAHTDPVGRTKAEACCNTIIGSKDASEKIGKIQGLLYDLVRMTDKFNY